jgi:elongation factor Ts
MSITAAQVKELREKTGAGMMDAKNALVEAGGDMDKAAELLRQKGIATAEKKSGRVAAEGLVQALVSDNGHIGAMMEVNCETDFVARGEAFTGLVNTLTRQVLEQAPETLEALMAQPLVTDSATQVQTFLTDQIGSIKENITPRRFVRFERTTPGRVHAYIHTGGKIGVLVELSAGADKPELATLAKDIAMQIASAAPEFVSRTEIPASVIEEETRVEMGKEDILSKPEAIREKIVAGRVDKLMAQKVLLEQPFVKDPSVTIADMLDQQSKALGPPVAVERFTRFVLGEGIEKKESNFVEEVMAAARGQ